MMTTQNGIWNSSLEITEILLFFKPTRDQREHFTLQWNITHSNMKNKHKCLFQQTKSQITSIS